MRNLENPAESPTKFCQFYPGEKSAKFPKSSRAGGGLGFYSDRVAFASLIVFRLSEIKCCYSDKFVPIFW